MNRRTLLSLGGAAAVLAVAGGGVWAAYASALARANARVSGRSALAATRFGPIEYAIAGEGPPVLMIHGSGGGFDQGLAATQRLVAAGYQIIAPSRFGYLRSPFPNDPSSAHQADAFADLLDALNIERAHVIGGSAGALSALSFALRHRARCRTLAPIVPAAYAPNGRPEAPLSPFKAAMFEHALNSDFLFWSALVASERTLIGSILATDPELVAAASAEERARVRTMLWDILPVSRRANGLRNDGGLAGNPAPLPLERIDTPTLAISLEDDRYGTFAAARHIAASVPGAELVSWPRGGHVWVSHDVELFERLVAFFSAH